VFGEKTNFEYEILTNERTADRAQLANEKTEERPQFAEYLQQGMLEEENF
jgi:hypothetical protein